MSESIFQYDKLENPAEDIRLLTLLPGEVHDTLKLRIRHTRLTHSVQNVKDRYSELVRVRQTLPASWDVFEALDGRFLYMQAEGTGGLTTSWEHPSSGDDPVATSASYSLQDSPENTMITYEALSYIWGSEEDPLEVLIRMAASQDDDDVGEVLIEIPGTSNPPQYCRLAVRRNLESSLRHLRYTDRKRVLWIDALCINQADIIERSEQVSRMKDVFRLAQRVMIWIGSSTEGSRLAMQTLDYLGSQVVHSKIRTRAPHPDAKERLWFQATTILPYDEKRWQAIRDLLERPWFQRLWVVQEAHLARKGVFLCGDDEMDWLTFRYALLVFWYNKESMGRWPSTLRILGNLVESLPEKHPITDLLVQVFGRACTDPRDRVYGIHGLFPRSFQKLVPIDYSLTAAQIYERTIVAHIKYSQRLEILRFCHSAKLLDEDLPSWVLDLSSRYKMSRRLDTQFSAGFTRAEVTIHNDSHVLGVTGVHCATVTSIQGPIPDGTTTINSIRVLRTWEPADLDFGEYPTGESVRDAYATLLYGNWLQDRMPERIYDQWLEGWKVQDSPTALFGDRAKDGMPKDAVASGFEVFTLLLLPQRTYLRTKEGYFGLGPPQAQIGM